jgi:AraC-like DNA-binding protein/mannose-6-phosphate isomerase-like protein (cupin superfamily)
MYHAKESEAKLNRTSLTLTADDVSFRVHYWGVDPFHYDNPVHKHSFFEVCCVWDGRGEYEEDGIVYPLHKGTLVCSRPGIVHQIRSRSGLSLLYVAFEIDESQTCAEEAARYRMLMDDAEVCVQGAGDCPTVALWRSLLLPDKDQYRLSDTALTTIAHVLLRSFIGLFSPHVPSTKHLLRSSNTLLRRAKLYIRDNLDRPITLKHLSDYLHVSERHVSRIFAGGIHESFNGYVRRERIQQSAYLLKHSDAAIKDIAARTGFGTVHSFTRAFARETGLPPGRYREQSGPSG